MPLHVRQRDYIPDAFQMESLEGLDLYEVTIGEIQHYLSNGSMTSVEYVDYCLDRIRRVCESHSSLFLHLHTFIFDVITIGQPFS